MPIVNPSASPAIPGVTTLASVSLFSDVRALRAGQYPLVWVLGGTVVGDGQDGVFYWSSSSLTADDGLTILAPNAGGTGRWIRLYSGFSLSSGASHVSTIQSGTGAVSTDIQTRDRQVIYITDFAANGVSGVKVDPTGSTDSTLGILAAETARSTGSTLVWPAGTYKITSDITASKAGAWLMQGLTINSTGGRLLLATSNFQVVGGASTLNFDAGSLGAGNSRAIRCAGVISGDSPGYGVSGTIAVGATSFTADTSSEAATLSSGDWIFVVDHDVTNWVRTEMKQVLSVSGTTINVTTPFAQAFDGTYTVEYVKVTTVRERVKVSDLTIICTDTANQNIAIDTQPGVVDFEVSGCTIDLAKGSAFNIYGVFDPKIKNNRINRQTGFRSAWSSNTGGVCSGNKYLEKSALSTNGVWTIETGSFGAIFDNNHYLGANGGAAVMYVNNAHYNVFENEIVVGNGANIGYLVQGASNNKIIGSTVINTVEGISFIKDTVLTPDMDSTGNLVVAPTLRNCTTGVRLTDANCVNTTIIHPDCDSTVTTQISNAGTGTLSVQRNNTVGALSFVGGIHVGNVANANANVLDQYTEVTTITPTVTFGTVGDLAVTYSTQTGSYTRIGNRVFFEMSIITSAFTYTTASGSFLIGGLPLNPRASIGVAGGAIYGWTSAGYGQAMAAFAAGDSRMLVKLMGSGKASTNASVTEFPTGSTINIRVSGHYDV